MIIKILTRLKGLSFEFCALLFIRMNSRRVSPSICSKKSGRNLSMWPIRRNADCQRFSTRSRSAASRDKTWSSSRTFCTTRLSDLKLRVKLMYYLHKYYLTVCLIQQSLVILTYLVIRTPGLGHFFVLINGQVWTDKPGRRNAPITITYWILFCNG